MESTLSLGGGILPATIETAHTWSASQTFSGSIICTGFLNMRNNASLITIGAADDVVMARDAAAVLALKNSTNAQTLRVYGTTTGTKYVSLSHNGTDGLLDVASSSGQLTLGGTNATGVRVGASGKNVGFYGTTPVALQTGVAVTAAGIHAALVNLGLITA